MEVFKAILGILINPISNFAFILKASKMLFHARTSDCQIFKEKNNSKISKIQTFDVNKNDVEESKNAKIQYNEI